MYRRSIMFILFFKQKTSYEMRISDWSSDVCSSDLEPDIVGDQRDEKRQQPIAERLDRGAPAAAPRGYEGRGEPDRARLEPDTFVVPGKAAFGCGGQRAIERCREIGRALGRERVCQDV